MRAVVSKWGPKGEFFYTCFILPHLGRQGGREGGVQNALEDVGAGFDACLRFRVAR